jgi:hypothetical protein
MPQHPFIERNFSWFLRVVSMVLGLQWLVLAWQAS